MYNICILHKELHSQTLNSNVDYPGLSIFQHIPCLSTISSLAVAITITSSHCAYPGRDGQAESA